MTTIEVIRGDDVSMSLTFRDNDGDLIDITGYTVFFTVKDHLAKPDTEALIEKSTTSHTDPTNGQTTIELTSTDTDIDEGLYDYDFQLKTDTAKINSTPRGTFKVSRDVTIRTS